PTEARPRVRRLSISVCGRRLGRIAREHAERSPKVSKSSSAHSECSRKLGALRHEHSECSVTLDSRLTPHGVASPLRNGNLPGVHFSTTRSVRLGREQRHSVNGDPPGKPGGGSTYSGMRAF